ncbi:MAG TPA: HAD family hydrolase [Myxococcales bacterium]|nr:HAD family hydrolase [Myxococcales bacterium]
MGWDVLLSVDTLMSMTKNVINTPEEIGDDDRIQQLLEQFQPENIPRERRVYVNRNLRMSAIELIGFDMDYTIAPYHTAVEELSIRMTMERLVVRMGYPKKILDLEYDPQFAIRGLAVDKRLGNLLKMDSHRHISAAYHGTRKIEKDERRRLYRHERIRMSADRYSFIDTLFAVPEAWLFAQLVDLKEAEENSRPLKPKVYKRLYDDIRTIIDGVHADQSLKKIMRADLSKFIVKDPELGPTLHRLRSAGKRLFLMTNSYGPYSQAVMSYLLDDALPEYSDWTDYFDIIVVGSCKPAFFAHKEPFLELGSNLEPLAKPVEAFEPGVIYQGGSIGGFEKMAGVHGDRILYVGDHLYGDILRSKKATTWRTAMIVPEMENELILVGDRRRDFQRRAELETHRSQLDQELHQQQQLLRSMIEFSEDRAGLFSPDERNAFKHAIKVARKNVRKLERTLRRCLSQTWKLNRNLDQSFNAHWGMLFKAQAENSLFGAQVEDYACIYTSRVSNMGLYSPFQYFRTLRDQMPHERGFREI